MGGARRILAFRLKCCDGDGKSGSLMWGVGRQAAGRASVE